MKKILLVSTLLTFFVAGTGCGHMYGHKKCDGQAKACDCAGDKTKCKGCAETKGEAKKECDDCKKATTK